MLQDLSAYSVFQTFSTLVIPTANSIWAPLSGYQIRQHLLASWEDLPAQAALSAIRLYFLAFSAGCLGAIAAAHHWHCQGGSVGALLALDGWGVALAAPFPISRLSHDRFTHDTSRLLGSQGLDFYADPPVSHLDLWRQPSQVEGWQVVQPRNQLTHKADARSVQPTRPLHQERSGMQDFSRPPSFSAEAPGQDLERGSIPTTAASFITARLEEALLTRHE